MNIDTLRSHLQSPSEDARFNAWMILYQAQESQSDFYLEREQIFKRKDPLLKVSFIRFLSKISEERAVGYILQFFSNENSDVVQAAFQSFKTNTYQNKLNLLLPFLKSSSEALLLFALEEFAQAHIDAAFWPILSILKSKKYSKKVFYKTLSVLRHYPDAKSFPVVSQWIDNDDEETRFLTTLILGALYESRFLPQESLYIARLKDPSARIRKSILWSLRRRPQKKYISYLLQISVNDEDAQVRQEALQGLQSFSETHVICHLISVIEQDTNRMVALKSESVLRSMPVKKLVKAFWKILKTSVSDEKHQKVQIRTLSFLAELQPESEKVFHYICGEIKKCTEEKRMIHYFESLQFLDHPKLVAFLVPYITRGSSLISYMALKTLIAVSETRKSPAELIWYLKTHNIPPLHLQMLLSFLVKNLDSEMVVTSLKPLRDHLVSFLSHENTNIRYLSIQILKSILNADDDIEPFLHTFSKEKDPEVRGHLQDCLTVLCTDLFHEWKRWVRNFKNQSVYTHLLLKSFCLTKILKEDDEKKLYNLLSELWSQNLYHKDLAFLVGRHLAHKTLRWTLFLNSLEEYPVLSGIFIYLNELSLSHLHQGFEDLDYHCVKNIFVSDEVDATSQKAFFNFLEHHHYVDLQALSIALLVSQKKQPLEESAQKFLYKKVHAL